jgi:hypothetical protein
VIGGATAILRDENACGEPIFACAVHPNGAMVSLVGERFARSKYKMNALTRPTVPAPLGSLGFF